MDLRRAGIPILIVLCCVVPACNGPSEPRDTFECADQTAVLLNDAEYTARSEAPISAPGQLTKNCQSNSRYCYYLGPVPVYTRDQQTVLDGFVGQDVLIVGKVVFPASGSGELWAGTICRVRR